MQTSYDENGGATSDTEYWLYLITYFLNNKYYCDENKNVKNVKMCFYIISMITSININNNLEPFTYFYLGYIIPQVDIWNYHRVYVSSKVV